MITRDVLLFMFTFCFVSVVFTLHFLSLGLNRKVVFFNTCPLQPFVPPGVSVSLSDKTIVKLNVTPFIRCELRHEEGSFILIT